MKELNEINPKISHKIRIDNATKIRDLTNIVNDKRTHGYEDIDFSLEVFNNQNFLIKPDRIGITLFYPNKYNPTHVMSRIFDISMGEIGFGKQILVLLGELRKKIGG